MSVGLGFCVQCGIQNRVQLVCAVIQVACIVLFSVCSCLWGVHRHIGYSPLWLPALPETGKLSPFPPVPPGCQRPQSHAVARAREKTRTMLVVMMRSWWVTLRFHCWEYFEPVNVTEREKNGICFKSENGWCKIWCCLSSDFDSTHSSHLSVAEGTSLLTVYYSQQVWPSVTYPCEWFTDGTEWIYLEVYKLNICLWHRWSG